MEIFYSNQGMPTVIINNIAYNFNSIDKNELLAQMALNPDKILEIKNNLINYLEEIDISSLLGESKSFSNLRNTIRFLSDISSLSFVIDLLEDAEETSIMLSVPQPYPSWIWNGPDKEWIAPVPYPDNVSIGIYMWDEMSQMWIPSEPKPHPSWLWSGVLLKWIAPVAYPIDAAPDQFIWSESSQAWVLNEQTG